LFASLAFSFTCIVTRGLLTFGSNPIKKDGSGFVVRVLADKIALKCSA
jgi:hypothetical protein